MIKKINNKILGLTVAGMSLIPSVASAADATEADVATAGAALQKIADMGITKGVMMGVTVGGASYFILKGFGLIGDKGVEAKSIVIGILFGAGFFLWSPLVQKIATTLDQ